MQVQSLMTSRPYSMCAQHVPSTEVTVIYFVISRFLPPSAYFHYSIYCGLFQGCCNTFAWNTVSALQTWKSLVYLINMRSQLSLFLLFLSCCSCICRCSLLPGPSTVRYTPLGVFHYINPLPQIFFLLKNKPSCKLSNRSDTDTLAAYCLRDHHKSDNLQ